MAFLLILIFIVLGLMGQRLPRQDAVLKGLNLYLIWVAVPAVTLHYLLEMDFQLKLLFPIAVAWICFIVALGFWQVLNRYLALERQTLGALILCSGLGNTSFLGFPMMHYFYAERGLQVATLIDQPGSFLVLSTLGIAVAAHYSGEKVSPEQLAKRVLQFPPFVAFLTVILLQITGLTLWPFIKLGISGLAQTLIPLALISVGTQLKSFFWDSQQKEHLYLGLALAYKLILSPLLIAFLYLGVSMSSQDYQICVLEAGMAPMITGTIVASNYKLNPPLCMLILSWGILLSLMTVPLAYSLFQWI